MTHSRLRQSTVNNRRSQFPGTLATIEQMKRDGVTENYAIGGAVGATFYIEPMATMNVDVFVLFRHGLEEAWTRFHRRFLEDEP